MRYAIILIGLAALTAGQASAQSACAERQAESQSRDLCRAAYIKVETAESGLRTVDENSEAACFRAVASFWEWQCRGFKESSRCRGGQQDVRVTLSNGEVTWECLKP